MKKIYTIAEAADIIGVNKETLRRWDKSGKFKSTRNPINNYRVYAAEKVDSFVKELQLEFTVRNEVKNFPTPFFETEFGKLYNLDVLKFFRSIEDETVDLIFADPPYNIKKAEWDTFQSQQQYVDWSMLWIEEAHRVLKPTGTLFICGFSEILADLKWGASHLFKGCKWLVWFYRNKANLGNDWGRSHESILHFRKSKDFTFNLDEVRIPYNEHTLKYPIHPQAESSQYNNGGGKKYVWQPHPKGAKPKDVLEIPTLSNGSWEKTEHSTQKPIELVKKCVLSSSRKGDLIVDPFGGSGTTYAVAEAFERNWIGTELEINYCKIIKDRLSDKKLIERVASEKDEIDAVKRRVKLRSK
ncbi:MAG: MerR family DNA-binding transcriptional regulator [Ignavibacteriae bacterium]|nr:MerR family DNA-binding transcriptional regulator [Ignavibacteriota bacterium]NOG96358.1 MerR family DNA-binding transcriptional regulator [Ignavibacteriota bacterium]